MKGLKILQSTEMKPNKNVNPLMSGGKKNVTHTAALFKYVWPFCYHQTFKGQYRGKLFYTQKGFKM